MRRCSRIQTLAIASAAALGPLWAVAADQSRPDYTIRSEARLVLLDVSVHDAQARFTSGLSKEDFQISENGRPQNISVFDDHDVPVTIGILVDESSSMAPKRAHVIAAAQTFIKESNPRDEIFVLNFNDRVSAGLPNDMAFSDDPSLLRAALLRGFAGGKTALNDAILDGLQHLERGRQNKKALVLISDGGDNASSHKRQEMLGRVESSSVTIYAIGLFDPEDPDRDPHLLERLAKTSGGEAYLPQSIDELVPVCRNIAKEIRTRYTIGYIPPSENDGVTPLRHIRVRVSAPGHTKLTARTRGSYRYDEVGIREIGKKQ